MKLGWNLLVSSYWNNVPTHANLLRQTSPKPPGEWAIVVNDTVASGLKGKTLYGVGMEKLQLSGVRPGPKSPFPFIDVFDVVDDQIRVRITDDPPVSMPYLTLSDTQWVANVTGLNPHLRTMLAVSPGPVRVMDLCGPYSLRGVQPPPHPFSVTGYNIRPEEQAQGWSDQYGWAWEDIAALAVPDLYVNIPTHVNDAGARECGRLLGKALVQQPGGPTRNVRVAFSNEGWRPGNRIRQWAQDTLLHLSTEADAEVRLADAWCKHAARMVSEFVVGFRIASALPVQRVVEWWSRVPWAFQLDPWNGLQPVCESVRETVRTSFDAIAIAPYCGEGEVSATPSADRIARDTVQAVSEAFVWRGIANDLGKELIGYEGGFHYGGAGGVALHMSPQAEAGLLEYLRAMRPHFDAFCLYGAAGPEASAKFGTWSHLGSPKEYTAPGPKIRAIARFLGLG